MITHELTHLADDRLVHETKMLVARDRATTAQLIAHLAEIDRRKLYLPAGFPSMFEYCVGELGMSEDQACNRIEVARKAREFPVLFEAIEDGRLTQTSIRLLAPHLKLENVVGLVAEASHLRKGALQILIAHRFPQPEALRLDDGVIALGRASTAVSMASIAATDLSVPERITPLPQNTAKPLSPNRFALNFVISEKGHDRMRYFQSLIGSRDIATAFERLLEIGIPRVEKQKFGAATRPRKRDKRTPNPRYIPMEVRRAAWMRDEGRCTFTSPNGHRCTVTGNVEFDHRDPVARGGMPTVENVRLLCRAHNQYEAERILGADFMERKRERRERFEDVAAALRTLRARPAEARLAAEHALQTAPDDTLEGQIKAALRWLRPRTTPKREPEPELVAR